MAKTVIDEMVVEIVGDQKKYQQTLNAAVAETNKAGKQLEAAGGDAGKLSANLERGGKAAIAASAAARGIDLTSPAQAAGSLSQTMGALPGPIGAIAGAAAGVVGAIVAWTTSANKAKEAANALFKEVTSGAITVQQAFDKAKVEDLTNAFDKFRQRTEFAGEAAKFFGRNFGESTTQDAKKAVEKALDEIGKGRGPVQKAMSQLFNSEAAQRSLQGLAFEQARQGARSLTRELELQAEQSKVNEDAAQRMGLVQKAAAQAGVTYAEAMRMIGPALRSVERAQNALSVAKLTKELEDQTRQTRMGEDAFKVWQLTMKGATAAQLEQVRAAQRAAQAAKDHAAAMERGKEIAKEVREPVEIYKDSLAELDKLLAKGAISHETHAKAAEKAKEAFEATVPEFQEFAKSVEEGIGLVNQFRKPMEVLEDQVKALEAALFKGKITHEEYEKTLLAIQAAADKANAAISGTPAAAARSAEALARITAFQERLGGRSRLPTSGIADILKGRPKDLEDIPLTDPRMQDTIKEQPKVVKQAIVLGGREEKKDATAKEQLDELKKIFGVLAKAAGGGGFLPLGGL